MAEKRKIGVLVMSYGTPESMDQIEAYYTHIRRGRPPSAQQLQDLYDRYEAIVGGFFPLRKNTDKQVAHLQETINRLFPEIEFICYQGMKHAEPFIEDGVQRMVDDGLQEAIGIVLTPHYSAMSVGDYLNRAQQKAAELGLRFAGVQQYHLHPKLIEAFEIRVQRALQQFAADVRDQVKIIFTAHSLPTKILEMNDPYPEQMLETSRKIMEQVGTANRWQFAWQSAGQTGIPWLGPDILQVLSTIREEEQVKNVIVCPIGFVSDHLEVLYDLDIEAKRHAEQLGMQFVRAEALNTDPLYMETLSEAVWALVQAEAEAR